jgi:hypothetical protein
LKSIFIKWQIFAQSGHAECVPRWRGPAWRWLPSLTTSKPDLNVVALAVGYEPTCCADGRICPDWEKNVFVSVNFCGRKIGDGLLTALHKETLLLGRLSAMNIKNIYKP